MERTKMREERQSENRVKIVRSVLEYVREGLGEYADALATKHGVQSVDQLEKACDEQTLRALGMSWVQRRALLMWIRENGPLKWGKTRDELIRTLTDNVERVDEMMRKHIGKSFFFETRTKTTAPSSSAPAGGKYVRTFRVDSSVALLLSSVRKRVNSFRASMNRRDEKRFALGGAKFIIFWPTVRPDIMEHVLAYLGLWHSAIASSDSSDMNVFSPYSKLLEFAPTDTTSASVRKFLRDMNPRELSLVLNAAYDMGIEPLCQISRDAMTDILCRGSRERIIEAFMKTGSANSKIRLTQDSSNGDAIVSNSSRHLDDARARLKQKFGALLARGERARRQSLTKSVDTPKADFDLMECTKDSHLSDEDDEEDFFVDDESDGEVEAFRKRLATANSEEVSTRIEMPEELRKSLQREISKLSSGNNSNRGKRKSGHRRRRGRR